MYLGKERHNIVIFLMIVIGVTKIKLLYRSQSKQEIRDVLLCELLVCSCEVNCVGLVWAQSSSRAVLIQAVII
jgi:hypothetical protein